MCCQQSGDVPRPLPRLGLPQWPALLGILALAVIPTIIAAATTVYEKLLHRLGRQATSTTP
ncbi:hypothetical protein [Streptomyces sp. NK08204]|uniref:hypothetical protein n=1 Tax=Streptomyces sp. NK08204 TaxID=2873260 RepID=UPI001CED045B|nr:hypothetical protein [Streptomyces sp. NK08204]